MNKTINRQKILIIFLICMTIALLSAPIFSLSNLTAADAYSQQTCALEALAESGNDNANDTLATTQNPSNANDGNIKKITIIIWSCIGGIAVLSLIVFSVASKQNRKSKMTKAQYKEKKLEKKEEAKEKKRAKKEKAVAKKQAKTDKAQKALDKEKKKGGNDKANKKSNLKPIENVKVKEKAKDAPIYEEQKKSKLKPIESYGSVSATYTYTEEKQSKKTAKLTPMEQSSDIALREFSTKYKEEDRLVPISEKMSKTRRAEDAPTGAKLTPLKQKADASTDAKKEKKTAAPRAGATNAKTAAKPKATADKSGAAKTAAKPKAATSKKPTSKK